MDRNSGMSQRQTFAARKMVRHLSEAHEYMHGKGSWTVDDTEGVFQMIRDLTDVDDVAKAVMQRLTQLTRNRVKNRKPEDRT